MRPDPIIFSPATEPQLVFQKISLSRKPKGPKWSHTTSYSDLVLTDLWSEETAEEEAKRAKGANEAGMSFMKGDLLYRTRKLVKGLAKAEPVWLKAMEHAPPATFPRADGKVKRISLPEDVYVKKFFQKHPDSKHEDAIKICGFEPPAARVFGLRVLDLKEQGISEEEAMAVADMEYRAEKKAKKKAYARLKRIARLQGNKPPPNPYPSAIKEIQAEERKYVRDRFFDPRIYELVRKLKEEKAAEMHDRFRGGG